VKKKILYRVFSILLSLSIVLPFAIQTLHALEGHEHTVCTAENEHHFHQQKVDCGIYHQNTKHNSFDFSNDFNLKSPPFFKKKYTYFYQHKQPLNLQLKTSRAPPIFIV